jgi:YggT family protein
MDLAEYIIRLILVAFLLCLFVRVLMSYFPISDGTVMASVQRLVGAVTDPILTPVRRLVPPLSLGGAGAVLDMSPIIVFIVIFILLQIV